MTKPRGVGSTDESCVDVVRPGNAIAVAVGPKLIKLLEIVITVLVDNGGCKLKSPELSPVEVLGSSRETCGLAEVT